MPSGKQILLSVLTELSQHAEGTGRPSDATDALQSALLFHQSTAEETWPKVANTCWLSETEADGVLVREGIGLGHEGIFLSDIVEQLRMESVMPASVRARFPSLSQERYGEALETIWDLLSALQYWNQLSSVEDGGHLSLEERNLMLGNMLSKLHLHKADPHDYLYGEA